MFRANETPTIYVANLANTPLNEPLPVMVAALQKYIDNYLVPAWGTPAELEPVATGAAVPRGRWGLVFLDDADQANALGYHTLTADGLPLSRVFVRTGFEVGESASVTASHEVAEMLVDPAVNLLTTGPARGVAYALEVSDPVEETTFSINGVPMSNFVTPEYYQSFRRRGSARFDVIGSVSAPFQILPGGYQSVLRNGRWSNIFGSHAKAARFAKEDRRGHRSEFRKSCCHRPNLMTRLWDAIR